MKPLRIIGHQPISNSTSSSRVKGFQLLTATAGTPLEKQARGRSSIRNRQRRHIGSLEKAHTPKKDLDKLALQFPMLFILKGIPFGSKKLSLLAQENTGSWIAPANSKERRKIMRQSKEKSVPAKFIKNSPPIFYCGNKTRKIEGIPVDGIVKNVSDSLRIVDSTHSFNTHFSPLNKMISF
jgi:hypothetical protein